MSDLYLIMEVPSAKQQEQTIACTRTFQDCTDNIRPCIMQIMHPEHITEHLHCRFRTDKINQWIIDSIIPPGNEPSGTSYDPQSPGCSSPFVHGEHGLCLPGAGIPISRECQYCTDSIKKQRSCEFEFCEITDRMLKSFGVMVNSTNRVTPKLNTDS